jgi:hypothetical protein
MIVGVRGVRMDGPLCYYRLGRTQAITPQTTAHFFRLNS